MIRKLDNIVLCFTFAATIGCGEGARSTPDAALRTVTVKSAERRFTSRGEVTSDSRRLYQRSYLRSSSGAFDRLPQPTEAGDTSVFVVGDGLLYLSIANESETGFGEIVVGPHDQVDASLLRRGHEVPYEDSAWTVSVDRLVPWRGDDQLFGLSPNSDTDSAAIGLQTSPEIGATSFGPSTCLSSYRVRASEGDELWMLQMRRDFIEGVDHTSIVSAMHRNDLEQTTAAGVLNGSFTTLETKHLDLDVRRSQFAALADTTASLLDARADLFVRPYGFPQLLAIPYDGGVSDPGTSLLMYFDMKDATPDSVVSLPYGNPYPSDWPVYLRLTMGSLPAVYGVPGASNLVVFHATQYLELPLADALAAPIVPLIGVARELRIDGQPPAQASQITATPTLSWQAPALGTARAYAVDIYTLDIQINGELYAQQRARFLTTETSVQVAPEILKPGMTCFFTVTAMSGDFDVLTAPRVKTGTYSAVSVASDSFKL